MELFMAATPGTAVRPEPTQDAPRRVTAESRLADAVESYCKALEGYNQHTKDAFGSDLKLFCLHQGPSTALLSIDTWEILQFLSHLRTARGEKPRSIHRRAIAIRHFYKWLIGMGVMTHNPAITLPLPAASSPLPDILTDAECAAFMEAARSSVRDHVIASLLLESGLKRQELLDLVPDDVDTEALLIRIRSDKRARAVGMARSLRAAVREYAARHPHDGRFVPISVKGLDLLVKGIGARAGIGRNVNCQLLRDTCGVRMLRQGVSLEDAMTALGLSTAPTNCDTHRKYLKLAELN